MSRLLLLFIWVFSGSSLLVAQDYLGSGRVEATSTGTTETTAFVSEQLGGYLYTDARRLVFEMKTTSFFRGLDVEQQNVLRQVWNIDAYPLMYFTFDVDGVDLTQDGASNFSVEWKMGDQIQQAQAVLSYTTEGNTLTLSWNLPVSLQKMGLEIPIEYADRMSDQFTFEVSDFALIQR
ncbi:MAG: hypothetical protein AAFR59_05250 [Bacteroidota bacterium]